MILALLFIFIAGMAAEYAIMRMIEHCQKEDITLPPPCDIDEPINVYMVPSKENPGCFELHQAQGNRKSIFNSLIH